MYLSSSRFKPTFFRVHFTPSADKYPKISIGPTATLALGKENYHGLENSN